MRLHIALDDALVEELDRRAGSRRRSAFIGELTQRGLDDERRWDDIEAALGGLRDTRHEWDDDPAAWVRRQRHADPRRTGSPMARLLLDSTVLSDALRGRPAATRTGHPDTHRHGAVGVRMLRQLGLADRDVR